MKDWERHTLYEGYTARHRVVKWFWQVVRGLGQVERARLLQYITSTSRVPAGGFSKLQGRQGEDKQFTIVRIAPGGPPRVHTCFNRLDLPEYRSYAEIELVLKMLTSADMVDGRFTME